MINNFRLVNQIIEQIKKYKGMFEVKKELLVVTKRLKQTRQFTSEYVVLNADSFQLRRLNSVNHQAENLLYYSCFPDNLIIYSQLKQNQPAVYKKDNNLILFDGTDSLPIVAVNELKVNDLSNALFIIAVGFIADLPFYIIRRIVKEID